jgi:hypothetical protein
MAAVASPAAPGDGGDSRAAELREDQWLEGWAFAISPHGLGISERLSWELTPREFVALAEMRCKLLGIRRDSSTPTVQGKTTSQIRKEIWGRDKVVEMPQWYTELQANRKQGNG